MPPVDRHLTAILTKVIDLRHQLHAHPQLGYEETFASSLVQHCLSEWRIPYVAGVAGTGVVAWIDPPRCERSRAAVGLRADLDALPIAEDTGLAYASTFPGRMHACGHDGHTAILLGTAYILQKLRARLPGPVKLLFQPAEEVGAGAQRMIEAGALHEKVGGRRVAAMFGLHGSPLMPVGMAATRVGALLAGCCDFEILVHGSGGHAALPHLASDPVVAASGIVIATQAIVARSLDPLERAVISVCVISGGHATNVIPDTVRLAGTIRAHHDHTFEMLQQRLIDVADFTARSHGCRVETSFTPSYPPVQNDAQATEFALKVAERTLGKPNVLRLESAWMASEDFAFYGRVVPASFMFFGLIPPGRDSHPMLHTPHFDFTDAALETGIRLMCGFALESRRECPAGA